MVEGRSHGISMTYAAPRPAVCYCRRFNQENAVKKTRPRAAGRRVTMANEIESLAVFCGSNPGRNPAFEQAAVALGETMVRRGIRLIYGGGNVGLMGVIADSVMAGGGEVIGVIPHALEEREVAHLEITRLEVVDDMHVRKQRMYALADGLVAMPGGIGTFEELLESLTWIQLGLHAKPCGVLNVEGYYDHLLGQLDLAADQGFLPEAHRSLLLADSDPDRLIDRFIDYRAPEVEKWITREDT